MPLTFVSRRLCAAWNPRQIHAFHQQLLTAFVTFVMMVIITTSIPAARPQRCCRSELQRTAQWLRRVRITQRLCAFLKHPAR